MGASNTKKWSDEQLVYMKWLSVPPALRNPQHKAELARQLDLDVSTFFYWEQKPGWDNACSLMALKTMKDFEPQIQHASLMNMLSPARGWQERVARGRYFLSFLYSAAEQGMFNEILTSQERNASNSMIEAKRQYALLKFAELPPEQQSTFSEILQGLGKLESDPNAVPVMLEGQELIERAAASVHNYVDMSKLDEWQERNGKPVTRAEKREAKLKAKAEREGAGDTSTEPTRYIIPLRPELQPHAHIIPVDSEGEYYDDEHTPGYYEDE